MGGFSTQNVVPLGSIFGFFIVVLNRFLQPLSFLIKIICLLIMSLSIFILLLLFHLTDLTTYWVTEFVDIFDYLSFCCSKS